MIKSHRNTNTQACTQNRPQNARKWGKVKTLPQRRIGGGLLWLPTLKPSTPSAYRSLEKAGRRLGGWWSGEERGVQKGQREGEQRGKKGGNEGVFIGKETILMQSECLCAHHWQAGPQANSWAGTKGVNRTLQSPLWAQKHWQSAFAPTTKEGGNPQFQRRGDGWVPLRRNQEREF